MNNTKVLVSSTELLPTTLHPSSSFSKPNHQAPLIISGNHISYYSSSSTSNKSRPAISIKTRPDHSSASRRRVITAAFYSSSAVTEEAVIGSTTNETLYDVLGISESVETSSDVIKKAYKRMARKYHPDVSPPERVDEYTRKFILVHEAYETLSDPRTRALYDRELSLSQLGNNNGSNFNFSSRKFHQRMEEEELEWRMRWQSQLDELKRRDVERQTTRGSKDNNMSWGARMRSQRSS